MNATLVRRLVLVLAAAILAGSAVAAADPVLVVESRTAPENTYSLAVEARALCVRFAVVITDRAVAVGPEFGCPTCRLKDFA